MIACPKLAQTHPGPSARTAAYCAQLRRYLPSDRVPVPSGARECSYIVHISLHLLPWVLVVHHSLHHNYPPSSKPLYATDGALLFQFRLQGHLDGRRTRLFDRTPQSWLSPIVVATMEFPCLPFSTKKESTRSNPRRSGLGDCPRRETRSPPP